MTEKTSADSIIRRLRKRYEPPEWVVLAEFHNATGGAATHRFDALAFNVWPSRGMVRVGLEVKVSRADFARELADHDKRGAIERHCHEVYFAVAKGVCEPREVPEPWGLLVEHGDGLRCALKPKFRDVGPMDPGLGLVALRRLHEQLAEHQQRHYVFSGAEVTQEQIDEMVREAFAKREERFAERSRELDRERDEVLGKLGLLDPWREVWKRLRVAAGESAWRMNLDAPPTREQVDDMIRKLRAKTIEDMEAVVRAAHARLADTVAAFDAVRDAAESPPAEDVEQACPAG